MKRPSQARSVTPHLVLTVLGAVAGSLFGALLWQGQPFPLLTIVLLTIPLAVVIALVLAPEQSARNPARPPQLIRDDSSARDDGFPRDDPHPLDPVPALPDLAPGPDRQVVVPAEPAGDWWENPLDPVAPEPTIASPADLDRYRSATRTVQCPRCGSFFVEVVAAGAGYRFRCRACGDDWRWASGQPWPEMRVDPVRRKLAGR